MYGPLTLPAVGLILQEAVRRAIHEIRTQRRELAVTPGASVPDEPTTSADLAAQRIYIELIGECLPGFGIIAEENGLRQPCTLPDSEAYVVIDPLDGTAAYSRGQAFGVATQLALVINGVIEAVFLGDVIAKEAFCYRPGSPEVHHILNLETMGASRDLVTVDRSAPLAKSVALLGVAPEQLQRPVAQLVRPRSQGGAVKQYEIGSGSLTLNLSRLWKGEVGLCVVERHKATPWDRLPVIGVCQRLGMVFLKPNADERKLERFDPPVQLATYLQDHDLLVLHEQQVDELLAAL